MRTGATMLLALWAGGCVVVEDKDIAFAIVEIDAPTELTSDAPAEDVAIYWEGPAAFPVTAVIECFEGGFPDGWDCVASERAFDKEDNPLVWPGAAWCSDWAGPEPVTLRALLLLRDADDIETPEIETAAVCNPNTGS